LTQSGTLDTENEFSFLTIETGVPGLLAYLGFVVTLVVVGFRRVRHEPDRQVRVWLAALVAPLAAILALFVISAASPTVPIGPYVFAVGGVISYWLNTVPAERARESRPVPTGSNVVTVQ